MRPRMHDGSYMEETPDTILAAMCGVSKHHESRRFEHKYLKILNVKEQQQLNIQETELKPVSNNSAESTLSSRCLQEIKPTSSFIAMTEKYCKSETSLHNKYNMITKDDLKLPNNFEPRTNVDNNDPLELLEATYISQSQGYNV